MSAGIAHQPAEAGRPHPTQSVDEQGCLLLHADRWRVDVPDRHLGNDLGSKRLGGQRGETVGPDTEQHLGQQGGELRLEAHRARVAATGLGHDPGQLGSRRLVRAVLQEPGEQQVSGLEEGEVVLVLHLADGQQPRRLQVEQGGGHHQEVGGLLEVPRPHRPP